MVVHKEILRLQEKSKKNRSYYITQNKENMAESARYFVKRFQIGSNIITLVHFKREKFIK